MGVPVERLWLMILLQMPPKQFQRLNLFSNFLFKIDPVPTSILRAMQEVLQPRIGPKAIMYLAKYSPNKLSLSTIGFRLSTAFSGDLF